jgi:hypothetical protein
MERERKEQNGAASSALAFSRRSSAAFPNFLFLFVEQRRAATVNVRAPAIWNMHY